MELSLGLDTMQVCHESSLIHLGATPQIHGHLRPGRRLPSPNDMMGEKLQKENSQVKALIVVEEKIKGEKMNLSS